MGAGCRSIHILILQIKKVFQFRSKKRLHKKAKLSRTREYDRARRAWETAEQREVRLRLRRERDKESSSKFR